MELLHSDFLRQLNLVQVLELAEGLAAVVPLSGQHLELLRHRLLLAAHLERILRLPTNHLEDSALDQLLRLLELHSPLPRSESSVDLAQPQRPQDLARRLGDSVPCRQDLVPAAASALAQLQDRPSEAQQRDLASVQPLASVALGSGLGLGLELEH